MLERAVMLQALLDPGLLTVLRVLGTVVLVVLLAGHELAAHAGPRWRWLVRWITLSLVPLLLLFALTVASITYAFLVSGV